MLIATVLSVAICSRTQQGQPVWNYRKNYIIGSQSIKNDWEFYKRVMRVMLSPQKYPAKMKSFFKHR